MKSGSFIIMFLICLLSLNVFSQEENTTEIGTEGSGQNFTLSADLVSSYIWRGLNYSSSPNIQPYLAYTFDKANITVGSFGSYSLGSFYSEVDLFASATFGMFTLEVWDYFNMYEVDNNHFFDFKNASTGHAMEGIIMVNGPESFPLKGTIGTFFYGNDKNNNGDNAYSTYFELAYPFKWKQNNLSVFIGGTPREGFYASDFAINNIGITNEREIKINDKFSLPVSGSLILNPFQEGIFLVFTVSLEANN